MTDTKPESKYVVARRVVSKPSAALEVVEIVLTPEAARALSTRRLRLGPDYRR